MCISLCFWKHDTPLLNFIINFVVNEVLKTFLLQVNLLDIVISSTCTSFMSLRLQKNETFHFATKIKPSLKNFFPS